MPTRRPTFRWTHLLAAIMLTADIGLAQVEPKSEAPANDPKTYRATGTFEVSMRPLSEIDPNGTGAKLARMAIDKQFAGDLVGTGVGEMLSAMTDTKGSAGYVAIERVAGTLNGRNGSFVLQHSGTMARGEPILSVTVVPDSGTGELSGISGRLVVDVADGKHSYQFEYTLPE